MISQQDNNSTCWDVLEITSDAIHGDIIVAYFAKLAHSPDAQCVVNIRAAYNEAMTCWRENTQGASDMTSDIIESDVDEARLLVYAIKSFLYDEKSKEFIVMQLELLWELPHWKNADMHQKFQKNMHSYYDYLYSSSGTYSEMKLHELNWRAILNFLS